MTFLTTEGNAYVKKNMKKLYFTRLKNVNVASGQFVFEAHGIDVAW